jgi:hypothetical protein
VVSVVKDFKILTTEDTEFHRGKTQRSKFSLQHAILGFFSFPLRSGAEKLNNNWMWLARFR